MTDTSTDKQRTSRAWIAWLLLLMLLGAGAYMAMPLWPRLQVMLTRMETLEGRLITLEKKNTQLEERVAALDSQAGMSDATNALAQTNGNVTPETIRQVTERLAQLEIALTNIQSTTAPAAQSGPDIQLLQQQMASLQSEIETLRRREGGDNRSIALLVAFSRLQEIVTSGSPFRNELAKVDFLTPPHEDMDHAFDAIRPYADGGITTLPILKEDFAQVARRAMAAAGEPGKNAGWKERLAGNLSSLITIRRVEDVERDNSEEAVIARAESHLQESNLAEAVRELEALKGKTKEAFASWLEDARSYLTVTDAMDQLDQHIQELVTDPNQPQQGSTS